MAFDDPYAPVPDPLFLTTPKPLKIDYSGLQTSEPKLSLKTHNKAIDAWKEATESWKKRCLLAEKNRDELYDSATAWREVAADLAFGGRPYPEPGTPERDALIAKFKKVNERKESARQAGHPEEGPLA